MTKRESEGGSGPYVSLRDLGLYFLKLGALGFGGPIALAGQMQREVLEERKWVTHEEFQDGLAIAETMPGPLAAQLAMWIGYIRHGVLGATLVGILFVLPPLVIVVAVAAAYVTFSGLSQIRAIFYGVGPAAIAIIAIAAWNLARSTNSRDLKLWAISLALLGVTVVTRTELAWLFILSGVLGIILYAPPWRGWGIPGANGDGAFLAAGKLALFAQLIPAGTALALTLFFLKASLFTFGSGLAIVPFLHQGVVVENQWLDGTQFLDAVAVGIITPGPVVITAAFIGYLVGGIAGAMLASFGVFFPVWAFNVVIGRLFLPHRRNPHVRAFVKGATAAAIGAISGAAILLGQGALVDPVTLFIFLAALVILYFRKLGEPYVIALAAIAGLIFFRG